MASSRVDMPGISSVTLCRLGEEADVQDVSNQNAKRRRAHLEFNIADISPRPLAAAVGNQGRPARSRAVYALCSHSFDGWRGHCPSDNAMPIAASRTSSASTRSSIERANTIPPTHSVAIARARDRAACPLRCNACSKISIMTLSTVSNACRTRDSSRKKSVGKAIRGQVPSISSKCSRERCRGRTEPRCQQHAD